MKRAIQQAGRRLSPLYGRYRARLHAADAMDRDARIAYRDAHLSRLVAWAHMEGIDPEATTTKIDVREQPARYRRRTLWPTSAAATGGTTGAPLVVHRAFNTVIYEQATIDHIVGLQGINLARARQAVFRGDNIKAPDDRDPPYWRDLDARTRVFSSIHIDTVSATVILHALAEFQADVLYCYPSTLELLLAHVRKHSIEVRPRLVLTSSEYMPPALFDAVREVFGCPLVDYYGQAERVCFAWAHAASSYHFRHDYAMVELDRAGLPGIVVGTSYHNRAQLLMHYNTGDKILTKEVADASCIADIALGLAPFDGIAGRTAETMLLPDGRQIVGFNQMPRFVDGADFIQFLRTGLYDLDVHVVRGVNFSDATLAAIERNVRLKVPAEVTTRYVFGDAPLRTPRGKSPIYIDAISA